MTAMTVTAYPVAGRDVRLDANTRERLGRQFFDGRQQDPLVRRDFISVVCLAHNPADGLLYCGLTAFDNDILYTFDVETKQFRSLNLQAALERFDVKVHRSLEVDDDGVVYGATACLHDVDQQAEAPGGKLFRYDPRQGRLEILAIPVPHQYIQTILLDRRRRIIYGYTYPVAYLFRFDLDSRQVRDLGYVGRDAHSLVLDDAGNLWGTWLQTWGYGFMSSPSTSLLRYDPDRDDMAWLRGVSLPALHSGDIAYVDGVVNGGDGYIYFGTTAGALVRFDPRSLELKYLGRPLLSPRLPGLVVGRDGLLYGCGGQEHDTHLFAYDRDASRFLDLGRIYDPGHDTSCFITHWLCEPRPGLFYVAETDGLERSGYLWECQVRL